MTVRVVVVGGGITGLAAAMRLTERLNILGRPFQVEVLEASNRLGGVIGTFRQDGFLLEAGPDSFLSEKRRGLGLCQELGILRDVIETNKEYRQSFIAYKGRLVPVPTGFHLLAPTDPLPLLLSPLLSIKGKLRFLKEYFVPLQPQVDETLASFVRRRLGDEVLTRLAQPLLAGIYSADADKLSLRATFPEFLEMEKTGGVLRSMSQKASKSASAASGARYNLFVTLRNGMQGLIDTLTQKIGADKIRKGVSVTTIQQSQSKWHLTLSNNETMEADAVCLALPAPELTRLMRPVDPAISGLLASISYADSFTANFGFPLSAIKNPMRGFGFVVPETERLALSACTFAHRKFPGRAPEGHALLRAYAGGKTAAALSERPETEIKGNLLADLRNLLGISGNPIITTLQRYRRALPQYNVGHVDRMKEIDEKMFHWPGLSLAGNWRKGVGIPDCIDSGETAAEALILQLCKV